MSMSHVTNGFRPHVTCRIQENPLSHVTKGLVVDYGEGGAIIKREGGGQVKFCPYKKGRGRGAEKSFSHAEGG